MVCIGSLLYCQDSLLQKDFHPLIIIKGWKRGSYSQLSTKYINSLYEVKSLSHVRLLTPRGLQPTRLLHPWGSPGKNTGVGYHVLLQGIFLTQESNPHLLHQQVDSLLLVPPAKSSINQAPNLFVFLQVFTHYPFYVPRSHKNFTCHVSLGSSCL